MKVKEFISILKTVPQDCDVEFTLQQRVSDDNLEESKYRYPYKYSGLHFAGYDIGYSNKVIEIFVSKEI